MASAGLRLLTGLFRRRWLRWGLCAAGWPFLGLACGPTLDVTPPYSRQQMALLPHPPQSLRMDVVPPSHVEQASRVVPAKGVIQASHVVGVQELPPAADVCQPLPIDLDTVLHLAEEQNAKIGGAREKLRESVLQAEVDHRNNWLPKITAGGAYFRHEGGIQNPDGTFVHSSSGASFSGVDVQGEMSLKDIIYKEVNARRKQWQEKAEVSQVTNEVLLEAATTYCDLLAARRAEAISRELLTHALRMLKRAEDQKKVDPGARVIYEGVLADVTGRRQALVKMHQQGDAAAAKLGYLLGLPPTVCLTPVDGCPAPINLVDASPPTMALVDQALTTGPGVQELQGLIAVIEAGMARLEGPVVLLPALCFGAAEGVFNAGQGSQLTGDNRFDAAVGARWNLTEWFTFRQQKDLARSRLMQAQLAYQDLRAKLTAGVTEARSAILAGKEQLHLGEQQLIHASEAQRLGELAVTENAPGASISQVMLSLRGLDMAHASYLAALSAHDKAELRLLLFLGPDSCRKVVVKELPPVHAVEKASPKKKCSTVR